MPRNQKINAIHCGHDCSMAVTVDGYLMACGLNTNNKLGLSTFFRYCEKSPTFIPVKLNRKIKTVAMGRDHTAVLTQDGYVLTVGRNKEGQLGRGHLKDDTYFREVKVFSKHMINVRVFHNYNKNVFFKLKTMYFFVDPILWIRLHGRRVE